MDRLRQAPAILFLAVLLLAAGGSGTGAGGGSAARRHADADAARLVEEVLRKAGGDDGESLGAWTRSILDRALERAGETARQTVPGRSTAPLPAERHAGDSSDRVPARRKSSSS